MEFTTVNQQQQNTTMSNGKTRLELAQEAINKCLTELKNTDSPDMDKDTRLKLWVFEHQNRGFPAEDLLWKFNYNHFTRQAEIIGPMTAMDPASEFIFLVCDMINSDQNPHPHEETRWVVPILTQTLHPYYAEDVAEWLDGLDEETPDERGSLREVFKLYEDEAMEIVKEREAETAEREARVRAEVELSDYLSHLNDGYFIDRVEQDSEAQIDRSEEEYYYESDFILRNGEVCDESIYLPFVKRGLQFHVARMINDGFTDSTGDKWKVRMTEPVSATWANGPTVGLEIVGRYEGPTPLHQMILHMSTNPYAPSSLMRDIWMYVHDDEETLREELPEALLEEYDDIRGAYHLEEE